MSLYDDDGIDGPFERGMAGDQSDEGRVWDAFSRLDGVGAPISNGDVKCVVELIRKIRGEERERCAQLCEKRCKNRVTGAVLAGLMRGGNKP
jgi:hypothetical protein